ncbi:MAG: DUF305 domain-containing protein [Candidatus Moraniibacteriota bacterium]|nr:MAG: DUF305 domain-containing protein [Candidatus Moranbacteria bacterium]
MPSSLSLPFAIVLMIITGILGMGIGYSLTPEYRLSMYEKNTMNLGRADRTLDLRYVNAMIAHHRGAMLVAEQAKKSERAEVKNLAEVILKDEPKAIAELYAWKKDWYQDERKVVDPIVPILGTYDKSFDLRFLNAVIVHHENGIVMTQDVRLKSNRSEVLDNADAVEAFLKGGIAMLKEWRSAWYSL